MGEILRVGRIEAIDRRSERWLTDPSSRGARETWEAAKAEFGTDWMVERGEYLQGNGQVWNALFGEGS